MASITFYGLYGAAVINDLGGSGVGFYGSTFGESVKVAEFQQTSYITDSVGTSEGPALQNCRKNTANNSSVLITDIDASNYIDVRRVPNLRATLNVRFEHSSSANVDNAEVIIFDRSNINNDPSGVNCYVYECIKPSTNTSAATGLGGTSWTYVHGSTTILGVADSPGTSGFAAITGGALSLRHDWYVMLSATPTSIGSKDRFGLFFQLEYL